MANDDSLQLEDRPAAESKAIDRAFGAGNRNRLINQYFENQATGSKVEAWEHVYRLLLWSDPTTGLAHCYESDKSQPGKPWYARSLAFHDWISIRLGVEPLRLAPEIDWLFTKACEDLSAAVLRQEVRLAQVATQQRRPYGSRVFPEPGADPELAEIIRSVLTPFLAHEPPAERWLKVTQYARQFLALQNKRKNLVGEGFEDVLGQIVRRYCSIGRDDVLVRHLLYQIPGFNRARHGAKENKVDLAIIRPAMRTIVTAKWSVRADREKQFPTEYDEYINAEAFSQKFQYVFVTNEFDPARLMRACANLHRNSSMFDYVVHISTDAIRAAYTEAHGQRIRLDSSWRSVLEHIEDGRLISLDKWLQIITNQR